MQKEKAAFVHTMSPNEKRLGWLYLPLHLLVLPILLNLYASLGGRLSTIAINVVYYSLGLVYVLVLLRRYLRAEFERLMDNKLGAFITLVITYFFYVAMAYVTLFLLSALLGDVDNPNNEAVYDMSGGGFGPVFAVSVFMAPIVEEVLFRGVVFGTLRTRSRLAAYAVSVLLFSLYHVWQYALGYRDAALLIYGLQYVAPAIALAWCYERSGSLWPGILFHMITNAVAMLAVG